MSRQDLMNQFFIGEKIIFKRRDERIEATVWHFGINSICITFFDKDQKEKFYWANPKAIEKIN